MPAVTFFVFLIDILLCLCHTAILMPTGQVKAKQQLADEGESRRAAWHRGGVG
jgi:hypothetical protein